MIKRICNQPYINLLKDQSFKSFKSISEAGYPFHVINTNFITDGQAIAIKLRNQIDRVVASINRNLAVLNGLMQTSTSFDDVKNPLSDIYNVVVTSDAVDDAPNVVKEKAINLLYLKDRCQEELLSLTNEMSALSSFLLQQIQVMESFVLQDVCSEEQKGLRSIVLTKQTCYESELQSLKKMWSGIVEISRLDWNFETFLLVEKSDRIPHLEAMDHELLDETTDAIDIMEFI